MAKYKVRLKLTGFELEIEGSREDIPLISQSLGRQIGGLLQPAAEIIDGEILEDAHRQPISTPANDSASDSTARRKGRRKGAKSSTSGGAASGAETPAEWRHDTSKYGSPMQGWSGTSKALWLLYVAGAEANEPEMSGGRITATFNKHFRTAGLVRSHNLNRDLAKLKVARDGTPPWVSEDTTKTPPAWFLTDAGRKAAQDLVAQALGQKS